jgi:hypothetical protein
MVMPEEVQPGWQVVDSFGEEIGTVLAVNGPQMRVKLYGGGETDVPNSWCALIETGRVELSKTKKEMQSEAAVKQP